MRDCFWNVQKTFGAACAVLSPWPVCLFSSMLEWITLSDKDSRQGRRESSWVSTSIFLALSQIVHTVLLAVAMHSLFSSTVLCVISFQYILPFAVLTGVLGYVDLCVSLNKTKEHVKVNKHTICQSWTEWQALGDRHVQCLPAFFCAMRLTHSQQCSSAQPVKDLHRT